MISPEDLAQCILVAATQTSPYAQHASSMLDRLRLEHPNRGARLCLDVLQSPTLSIRTLPSDQYFHILFFILSTLQYYLQHSRNHGNDNKCNDPNGDDENNTNDEDPEDDRLTLHPRIRFDLRLLLFQYIQQEYETNPTCIKIPTFIRTKIALLFTLLIQQDFLRSWSTAFEDLIQQLVTPIDSSATATRSCTDGSILHHQHSGRIFKHDIFLRILDSFCDEVVEDTSKQYNTWIKDAIRNLGRASEADTVHQPYSPLRTSIHVTTATRDSTKPMIVSILLQAIWDIIHTYKPLCYQQAATTSMEDIETYTILQQIPILGLTVFNRFIPWVDIALVHQPQIGIVMEEILSKATTRDSTAHGLPPSQLAVQALRYYHELLIRGMEENKKLQLLIDLNTLEVLQKSGIHWDTVDETHITVVIKAAEIINVIGLEMIPRWEESNNRKGILNIDLIHASFLETTMSQILFLFYKCLAYADIDVSSSVFPLASCIITCIENEKQGVSKTSSRTPSIDQIASSLSSTFNTTTPLLYHMQPLLTILYKQMRYPSTFQFDFEDEDEAEEEIYRTELRKLYISLCRVNPNLCLEFLCNAFSSLPIPLSSAHSSDVEAVLRLLYHYCEGLRPPPGVQVALKSDAFTNLLLTLHRSDVAMHFHREILILYYDISVRYCSFFNRNRNSELSSLLSALTGVSGIQHSHPRVRSRSCYLLLKLVQAMGKGLNLYTEAAVMGIQGLVLRHDKLSLEDNDVLYLFETVGLLLGSSDLDESTQQSFLITIIEPHAISIEQHLSSPHLNKDHEHYGQLLSNSVAAIAYLTKGYPKPTLGIQSVLIQTLPLCHRVLTSLSFVRLIRGKVIIYLQRMIICLGSKSLSYLSPFIQVLINSADVDDIGDIGQLLYQICSKFKREAYDVVNSSILPFIQKCELFIPKVDDIANTAHGNIPPHLMTEQVVIKKHIFAMISYVVSNDLTDILVSAINVSSLEVVMKTMYDGALFVDDSSVKKYCLNFFRVIIKKWTSTDVGASSDHPTTIQNGLLHFLYTNLIPGLLEMVRKPTFNVKDANDFRVLRDIGYLLYDVFETRGLEEFQSMVVSSISVTMEIHPTDILTSVTKVVSAEQMSTSLYQWISLKKSLDTS